MSNKITKLFIGTPSIDQKVNVGYTLTIFNTAKLLPDIQTNLFILSGNSCITDARNHIVTFFYNTDSDYLLFLDSDVEINTDDIKILISLNKDIIGIPVAKKNYINNKLNIGTILNVENINDIELAEVDGISTSCLLISRKVIQTFIDNNCETYLSPNSDIINNSDINNKIYNIFKTNIQDNKFLSEDYVFCNQCIKYRYKIYSLLTTSSNHYGVIPFNYTKPKNVITSIYKK